MSLDLGPLEDAVSQLEESLAIYKREEARNDAALQRQLRSATIQAFEFTYEVTFKMLRRHLAETAASPATIEDMTFNEVIREAFGKRLVCSDVTVWRKYRKNRGTTSHTYNEDKAQEIFEGAADFLQDVQYTLARLKEMNMSVD
ncbi:MAG: HI0074 family nucleotidyltransferase substrate-binding subunit [Thaumarchaeota archaeon]|nr:HI0074 family nucleotidyltransferase substrate-binding subunit [Nitrososphaerota archaeon]